MSALSELPAALAVVPLCMGILVIAIGLLRVPASGRAGPAELAASLSLGLEFFLAGGLLRLSSIDDFAGLAVVAAIVLLRKLIGTGVRFALRALGAGGVRLLRA